MWRFGVLSCVVSVIAQSSFTIKPIEEVVRELGYEVERHNITTADGYVLTYHRIPRGRIEDQGNELPPSRKVLLFNNGILLSSASVLTDRRDFAYEFADAGFDVWLGNYRGNMYSRRHRFLDPDRDPEFWDFSLHELGTQDLAASIDYILGVTGTSRLLYVGVSMGTTMFWVLGAARPQYMDKVEAMVALAPVARTSHSLALNSPARRNNALKSAVEGLGYREVFSYRETFSSQFHAACTRYFLLRSLCLLFLNTFEVLSRNSWDNGKLIEVMKYSPAGIATKVLRHFIQIAKARKFQQFDYGPEGNRQRYNSDTPPEYNLKNINCSKIYIISSDADMIADKQDVEWLSQQLPVRPTRLFADDVKYFSHISIGLDKRATEIVIRPLANLLKRRHLD